MKKIQLAIAMGLMIMVGSAMGDAAITFHVTGNGEYGFVNGQDYDITFTYNENFTQSTYNNSERNLYYIEQASQGVIVQDIAGSAFTGSYEQPNNNDYSACEVLGGYSSTPDYLTTYSLTDSYSSESLGLYTHSGSSIWKVEASGIRASGLDFVHSDVSVGEFLATHAGTYEVTSGSVKLALDNDYNASTTLNVSGVTVIPEPASAAMIGLVAAGAIFVRRIFYR